MTNQEILDKLEKIKNGCYFLFTKTKDLGNGVTKVSEMRMRKGVDYSKLSINEGRTTGELPWGHWVNGLRNIVIEHKGKYYLRVTSCDPEHPENNLDIINITYLLNGQVISKEVVVTLVEEKKLISKPSSVYNIKFENIISISL